MVIVACMLQRDLTGFDNLEEVQFLELRVDARDTSLGNFGMHVPNLTQLKLSNSIIACMRYNLLWSYLVLFTDEIHVF